MSTIRNPVGPQPSNVYWRRRLLVILGVLVVILIIVLLIVSPRGSNKPIAAKTPSAPPTTPVAAIVDCKASGLDVEAVTDKLSYASGVLPKLSLSITNTGSKACTFKVGSDVQDYEITTGTQKVWSSKDCQTDAVAVTKTLEPGTPLKSAPFEWNRTASDPAKCKVTGKKQVVAGGASYHLSVSVNGVASKKTQQFVLK